MERIAIALENCYGIKKLEAELDLSGNGAAAIYAPNGAMKSSLAQTFRDIAEGKESGDRIFPDRVTKRVVNNEAGQPLDPSSIVVIKSYDEVFGHNEKTSTLLVDSSLRLQYEKLHVEVNQAKEALLKQLKKVSGSKRNIEKEVSLAFTRSDNEFMKALRRVRAEVEQLDDSPLQAVRYDLLFDDKPLEFLGKPEINAAINDYILGYNALLAKSTYFKKGVFNYYNAATIAKNLADNGFFRAKHSIRLNGEHLTEIADAKQLEALIQEERDSIVNDPELKKKFADIEKQITKNQDLRDLHAYLLESEDILPHLANMGKFKEDVWTSYLKASSEHYFALLEKQEAAELEMRKIEEQASAQSTQWEDVIRIFNDRFSVPFKLKPENKVQVMLGQDRLLTLGFSFDDGAASADVERSQLMKALSTGELKAFYVLNVIFEMEVRRKAGQKTLFVVDDIADSFDYKNKYAIIEYLRDIADNSDFRQLLLTHNFDFFRTVASRYVNRKRLLMATRSNEGVKLESAYGVNNVFAHWKTSFFDDATKKIACIPFIRNIIEYTQNIQDAKYLRLTSMLHVKADSEEITVAELDEIFRQVFGQQGASQNPNATVFQLIIETAEECLNAPQGVNFENKIVLSIAIRLLAEKFMVSKINDPTFVAGINSNQTNELYKRYREHPQMEAASNDVLRQVMLMTPESIHLNSFMYEPILDMADDHLKRLYGKIKALQ
ncbi:hypothetical protein NB717_000294 [Xanthomonas sacchari]|uniref:phage infection protein n=1 Tax=Xanthomonas sacchari TaxID=56458 RepID=UPI00225E5D8D|nr:phage infection protein [Xanthomonas sacchari]MCW0459226.1 hypothetical protein [Xanthomonas sacchari]